MPTTRAWSSLVVGDEESWPRLNLFDCRADKFLHLKQVKNAMNIYDDKFLNKVN